VRDCTAGVTQLADYTLLFCFFRTRVESP